MLRWSIATVCLGGTLESKLAAAARAGFRAVELFENDLTFFSGRPRDVRTMADDLGLEIVALQPLRDFEAMPEPMRGRNFDRAKRKLDLMHEIGASLLCLCSNVSEAAIDDAERAAHDLAELADLARQHNFQIGYEALAWGRHVKDWTAAWDIVRMADRANCGIVLDSFHACVRGNPIEPMAMLPADKIALVQVADAPAIVMDPLSLSRHHRCYPGQGAYPIDAYLDAVTRAGYSGPISLEIFNEQFRGASVNVMALDGLRSLKSAGERLNGLRAARGDAPLAGVDVLPPAPVVEDLAFVEFAVEGRDQIALDSLLRGLGFSSRTAHRSKDVDLYRQGGIAIVLNHEREGFAHAFHTLHGPSVCALALQVDSSARAVDRAAALGAPTYFGRIGPQEASIPAVRGIEESLLYFIEAGSGWEKDFPGAPAVAPGLLTRVDHLSHVVRRSEFLTWALFYKTILGFADEPQVEVADPYGAFYSRSLRSPDAAVRIPINIGDGGATTVSRFIDAFGGAGVQQIAFATENLFGAVEAALAAGVKFLDIPDNYYDDLDARFAIAPDMLARMRALGILYDATDTGTFLHIYTRTFEDRFFFEIVERHAYTLFGAANTPVRLAAQTRTQDEAARLRFDIGEDR